MKNRIDALLDLCDGALADHVEQPLRCAVEAVVAGETILDDNGTGHRVTRVVRYADVTRLRFVDGRSVSVPNGLRVRIAYEPRAA